MVPDYTKLVLRDYEEKRARNALSSRLTYPTTVKLREECLMVCSKGYARKDARILSDFFEVDPDQEMLKKKIEKYDADKFKPLLNFINRKTKSPDFRVIELLAWLIDFEPRPHEIGKLYPVDDTDSAEDKTAEFDENGEEEQGAVLQSEAPGEGEQQPENVEVEKEQTDPEPVEAPVEPEGPEPAEELPMGAAAPITASPKSGFNFKTGGILLLVIALVLVGMIFYRGGKNKDAPAPMGTSLPAQESCMYWTGDHYQPISCSQKLGDTLIIALDTEKLSSFKRITTPDTITEKSKGLVWYVKINGAIEFYTSDGYHPTDPRLRLRPITDYIIRKYLHSGGE